MSEAATVKKMLFRKGRANRTLRKVVRQSFYLNLPCYFVNIYYHTKK